MIPTHKIAIKIFTAADTFEKSEFVPIFHHWIQNQDLPGHGLIDVADYAHVIDGPGTALIASEANIYMDRGENRLGLLYVRKQSIAGLLPTIAAALQAATKLQADPSLGGRLKFRTDEISIRFNDRLATPNSPATFDAMHPDIESAARLLAGGGQIQIENHNPSPLTLLDVRVKFPQSPALADMLNRAASSKA
jgi:hypothetical protein